MSIIGWPNQVTQELWESARRSTTRMVNNMINNHHFFIPAIIVMLSFSIYAENARFNDITADSINFITIDSYNSSGTQVSVTLNECRQIKRVLGFLKDMNIYTLSQNELLIPMDREAWFYKISFDGYQCKVYIFENRTFISKSVYRIDQGVLAEFKALHKDLIN